MDKKQFQKLQSKWYSKLAQTGFEDIEEPNSPREMLKKWHGSDFRNKRTVQTYEAKLSYFTRATHFLTLHRFATAMDRAIWAAHADGLSYRETATKLDTNRDKVHKTVIRLKRLCFGNID